MWPQRVAGTARALTAGLWLLAASGYDATPTSAHAHGPAAHGDAAAGAHLAPAAATSVASSGRARALRRRGESEEISGTATRRAGRRRPLPDRYATPTIMQRTGTRRRRMAGGPPASAGGSRSLRSARAPGGPGAVTAPGPGDGRTRGAGGDATLLALLHPLLSFRGYRMAKGM